MIKQLPIEYEIKKRKLRWIGHTHSSNLQKASPVKPSHGTPQGTGEEVGKKRYRERNQRDELHQERDGETENSGVPWSMAYAPSEPNRHK